MFENYQNLDTRYTPNNYQNVFGAGLGNDSLQSNNPNRPYEVKDTYGNVVGYFWYYGDSVVLSFDVVGEATFEGSETFVDVDDILSQCNATLTIYNLRYNIVSLITVQAQKTMDFEISGELSSKMVKDKYRMSLVLTNDDTLYRLTIFSQNDCVFEVR